MIGAATVTSGADGAPQQAPTDGYSTGLIVGASILLAAAVLALLTLSGKVTGPHGTDKAATRSLAPARSG